MEDLLFDCPKTRHRVDVGVVADIGTLLRIRTKILRAQCPACGDWHEWPVADAFLAGAA